MFAKIKALLLGEVKTVETIVAGWLDKAKELELHAASQIKAAVEHNKTIEQAQAAVDAAQDEAKKAIAVAEKIKAAVSA